VGLSAHGLRAALLETGRAAHGDGGNSPTCGSEPSRRSGSRS